MNRAYELEKLAGTITETHFSEKVPLSKKSIKTLTKSLPGSAGEILNQVRKGDIIPDPVSDEDLQKTISDYLEPRQNEHSGHPASC